ncbi:MAG: hypothetical protein ABJK28_11680 [Algibacter sp.]
MIKPLSKNIRLDFNCFLVFFITVSLLQAQEAVSKPKAQSSIPDIEKIYLHTDRSYYNLGESLWYKAYSVYAYNNVLFDHSNILYVELISPNSKIIARNKTRLEEGLGHGDFKLTDSIGVKAGTYQIRAYTNWNRNFDDDFIFKKEIEILDVFDKKNDVKYNLENKIKTENTLEKNEKAFKVQLFPEGGSLIEDVISDVAFKAVDNNGLPIAVRGQIYNSDDKLVTMLVSLHDGMGKFKLKPAKGETYYAIISTLSGDELKISIPKVKEQGYLLSTKKLDERKVLVVKTNQKTLENYQNKPVIITSKTRGITYFERELPVDKTTIYFELPKTTLQDGIAQVTLYDAVKRPQSERLIYIEKNEDLNITMSANKAIYKPKEQVVVNISSKTKAGEVMPASFSLSSIDLNGDTETKDLDSNISSYFLMESDIKGKVHNPGYYFDSSNPKRLDYLDLLLLTQGWRDFLWKEIPQIKGYRLPYKEEKGILVKGRVKQRSENKPLANSNISLTLFNKGKMNMLTSLSDANGRFNFENLVFMGKATMMINSRGEKGISKGVILLDSLSEPAMEVDFIKDSIPIYTPEVSVIRENMYRKNITFGITGETVLDEVEIIAKKKEENNIKSLYGAPDYSYVIDEKTQHFSSIYLLIQFSIPGVRVVNNTISFARNNGPAQIIVDGFPTEQGEIEFMQTDDIAKIESMNGPSAAIFGSQGANGAILIYTKEGASNRKTKTKKLPHSITKQIEGLYEARVFYSPNPNEEFFETENKSAIRNTLYWNPYIHPDETGDSKVSYYNSEVETNVKITLEGITVTGIPVVVKTNYMIEK